MNTSIYCKAWALKKPINVLRQSKNSRFLLWFSISTHSVVKEVKRMPLNPFEKEFIVPASPKLKTFWQVYFGINECQDDELSFFLLGCFPSFVHSIVGMMSWELNWPTKETFQLKKCSTMKENNNQHSFYLFWKSSSFGMNYSFPKKVE